MNSMLMPNFDMWKNSYTKQLALIAIPLFALLSACSTIPETFQIDKTQTNSSLENLFELNSRAQTAYRESRLIEAVQLYQKVINEVPNDADAWFRLGNVYAQQGSYERAIHAYESSLINNPQQPKAWFNLSTAYLLNAQFAMQQSYKHMRGNDPARALVDARLSEVAQLLHGRIEDNASSGLRTVR